MVGPWGLKPQTVSTAGTAKIRGSRARHIKLWVELWVEIFTAEAPLCTFLPRNLSLRLSFPLWDQLLIRRGLAALERAEQLGSAPGSYVLQAPIAACHGRARTSAETDWPRIVSLYQDLTQLAPSPIVDLNRAVALAMAFGPAAGLELIETLGLGASLKSYHLLSSVRGDLLFKLGRFTDAQSKFHRAASPTRNARERELLLDRAQACTGAQPQPEPQ